MQSPIATLYLFPRLTYASMTGVFDSSKPSKYWSRPQQSGESPADDYIYKYVDFKTALIHTGVMSVAAAAGINIPTVGDTVVNGEVPFPIRDLNPGETVALAGLAAFGAPPVVVTPDPPSQSAQSQADQLAQILSGVNAIRAALKV